MTTDSPSCSYTDPVAQLLHYRCYRSQDDRLPWPDYLALGLTRAHILELMHMVSDDALHEADIETPQFWAPLHAWRALGQLGAVEVFVPLFDLLERMSDDWLIQEIPEVAATIGPDAIPACAAYLIDNTKDEMDRGVAASCLEMIGSKHPDSRASCVEILHRQLSAYGESDRALNAMVIGNLCDLNAVETIETIRAAFAADTVDIAFMGDIEDVEIQMGLRETRDTPPPPNPVLNELPPGLAKTLGQILEARMRVNLDQEGDAEARKEGEAHQKTYGMEPRRPSAQNGPLHNPYRHVGRNDPCPCGSGKKFKKCCGG